MFKTFAVAALALSVSTAVYAADAVEQIPEAPMAVETSAFTWTGAYVGIQGGAGWLNGDFSVPGASASQDFDGGMVGGFVGYNWQFGNGFVAGVEGDFDYNWNEESFGGIDIGTDWSGAVRGRIGYAFDRVMVYGAGGWAITNGYVEGLGVDESETFNGWTVGAGVDFAVTDNMFIRGEYRYNDFGDKDIGGLNVDLDQHVVKAGIAVKF